MGGMTGRRANPENCCSCRLDPEQTGSFYLGKKKELILGMADPAAPKWRHTRESCGPVATQTPMVDVATTYSDGEFRMYPCEEYDFYSFEIPEDVWRAYLDHMDAHRAWANFIVGAENLTTRGEDPMTGSGLDWWQEKPE